MKRIGLSFLAVVLIAVAAYAATNVTSVNVVGYTKIQSPGSKLVLKAMSFDAFDQTLLGVFGTNQLNKATPRGGYGAADQIYIWDPSVPKYNIYAQDTDGMFYDVENWEAKDPVTNEIITAGTAFWILGGGTGGTTNEITMMGEVVDVQTQNVDLVEGLNLISYPFSTGIKIPDTDLVDDGAKLATARGGYGAADQLYVWTGTEYDIYAPDTNGVWRDIEDWTGEPVSNILEIGNGFWYFRQTGEGTLTWSETNLYLDNLN